MLASMPFPPHPTHGCSAGEQQLLLLDALTALLAPDRPKDMCKLVLWCLDKQALSPLVLAPRCSAIVGKLLPALQVSAYCCALAAHSVNVAHTFYVFIQLMFPRYLFVFDPIGC